METTNERTADDIYFDLECCEFCGMKLVDGTVHMTETRWGKLDICLSCALGQVGTIDDCAAYMDAELSRAAKANGFIASVVGL